MYEEGIFMAVSYMKLWHLLLDKNMKKKDLEVAAGISHYVMNKMRHTGGSALWGPDSTDNSKKGENF